MPPHVRGMIVMVTAMMFLPLLDAIGKWLATVDSLPPATISFSRFFVQSLLTLVIILGMSGIKGLSTHNLTGNLIRGALMGLGSLCFFAAVKYMPLADAIAIFFVEPLLLTLLSAFILKEDVGWRRLTAVVVGFIGTLIVIQPSWELFGWVSLLPLGTAACFAVYLIMNRKYGVADSPMVMQFYAGVGGTAFSALVLMAGEILGHTDMRFGLPTIGLSWGLLLAMGAIATVGHLLVVQAFRLAPASVLAPFQYFEIVMAVLIGLIVFNEFPTPSKWLGIFIIAGSGIYVFMRERSRTQEAKTLA
ncbi:DMT family transporter [Phyllobacterium salinisoli]|uniref:DMT family transporter n=2 Tax=Phyllobacterium salinisoli TaxID=1899321 RepID=A0A368K5U7_9HYPH|nr:DMT family transporter [Phyllobacterium salinisoli]